MKIFTWNVNGIRAAAQKGFLDFVKGSEADIIAIQEVKATPEQLDLFLRNPDGMHSFWHPAKKPGYSGVAILSRKEPLAVTEGIGNPEFDDEGRGIVAEFADYALINAYFPNSQRDHARLPFKLRFCREMLRFCQKKVAEGKHVVLCGDYNIAHQEIDLKNPKTNVDNAGFLPQERAWMDEFLSKGFVDAFRHFEKGPDHYTWWSYRPGVREKNIGWRLDYHCVNEAFVERLKSARIHPHILGSDHCPVELRLKT